MYTESCTGKRVHGGDEAPLGPFISARLIHNDEVRCVRWHLRLRNADLHIYVWPGVEVEHPMETKVAFCMGGVAFFGRGVALVGRGKHS